VQACLHRLKSSEKFSAGQRHVTKVSFLVYPRVLLTSGFSGRPSGSGTPTPIPDVRQEYRSRYQAAQEIPDLSQGHEAPIQASQMTTIGTTAGSQQWREDIRQETQADSSGYVPVSATSGPYNASPHSAFYPWSSFDPQLLEINYPDHLNLNEPCEDFPLSNGPIPSATYMNDVPTDTWNQK